jgi:hypothetical protein
MLGLINGIKSKNVIVNRFLENGITSIMHSLTQIRLKETTEIASQSIDNKT